MVVVAIVVALVILWGLALAMAVTIGGLIHLLLVAAAVMLVWKVLRHRRQKSQSQDIVKR